MPDPILFVTGLGRCGTTMLMRMLDHGGIRVAGPRPDYEDTHMAPRGPILSRQEWVLENAGRAIKWIDPLQARLNWNDWRGGVPTFILMRRDPEHQARSVGKLVGIRMSKSDIAAVAQSIRTDQVSTEAYLEQAGNVYSMNFEFVLKHPEQAAAKLALICKVALDQHLNVDAAAKAVIRRTPWCAPDLAIENRLLQEEAERG